MGSYYTATTVFLVDKNEGTIIIGYLFIKYFVGERIYIP
jgi:hypothetical protein